MKARQRVPVVSGEAVYARWGFRDLIARRAVDILQPDVAACGGISELSRIADMASAFGMRVNPHVRGTGVPLAASLHLLAVLPDNPPGLFPRPPLLEVDRSPHPVRDAATSLPAVPAERRVRVPEELGLGITVDRAVLQRFAACWQCSSAPTLPSWSGGRGRTLALIPAVVVYPKEAQARHWASSAGSDVIPPA